MKNTYKDSDVFDRWNEESYEYVKERKNKVYITLDDIITNSRIARFRHYQHGSLWYATDTGFLFPISVSDTGGKSFKDTEIIGDYHLNYIRNYWEILNAKLDK